MSEFLDYGNELANQINSNIYTCTFELITVQQAQNIDISKVFINLGQEINTDFNTRCREINPQYVIHVMSPETQKDGHFNIYSDLIKNLNAPLPTSKKKVKITRVLAIDYKALKEKGKLVSVIVVEIQ